MKAPAFVSRTQRIRALRLKAAGYDGRAANIWHSEQTREEAAQDAARLRKVIDILCRSDWTKAAQL